MIDSQAIDSFLGSMKEATPEEEKARLEMAATMFRNPMFLATVRLQISQKLTLAIEARRSGNDVQALTALDGIASFQDMYMAIQGLTQELEQRINAANNLVDDEA